MSSSDPEIYLSHMRQNLKLQLPEVRPCRAHSHKMCVVGGGPSLKNTKDDIDGYVCAINGSLKYMLEEGIPVNACGVVDPNPYLAEDIVVNENIHYYIASCAHPRLFERLKNCHVIMWHAGGVPGGEELIKESRPDDWFMIGGGTTMATRWPNIGYIAGFRSFDLHGLDSSFDGQQHAYEQPGPEYEKPMNIAGFNTTYPLHRQINDFNDLFQLYSRDDFDDVDIRIFGYGLFQHTFPEKTVPDWWENVRV